MSKVKSITDKLIKRVEIKLDGKTWPVVINHNLLIDVEDLIGVNVLTGTGLNITQPSAKILRAVLYLALKAAGANYTIEKIGDLIGPHNIMSIQKSILTAWAASMPLPEPDENPTEAAQ